MIMSRTSHAFEEISKVASEMRKAAKVRHRVPIWSCCIKNKMTRGLFCLLKFFLTEPFFLSAVEFLRKRLLIWFLLGLFLTTGMPPGQSETSSPIVQRLPAQLVQQGRAHYEAEQFQKAVEDLQRAANGFEAQGYKLNQAITLSNLSLAYQQLGKWVEAEKAITNSLQLLGFQPQEQISELASPKWRILAPALNIRGRLEYSRGNLEIALESWQQAAEIYERLGNKEGVIGSQINQVQALQALGLYQQARTTVEQVQQALEALPMPIQTKGWRSLGDVLRAIGDLENSQQFLQKSLNIVGQLNSSQDTSATLLSLGNTFWALGNLERDRQETKRESNVLPWLCVSRILPDEAFKFYQEAEQAYQNSSEAFPSSPMGIKAQLNRLSLLVETEQLTEALQVWQSLDLSNLSPSRTAVYAQINLARNLACLKQKLQVSTKVPSWQEIDRLLAQAAGDAEQLEDKRALSYALGNRGGFYEYLAWQNPEDQSRLQTAQRITSEALFLAQPSEAPSIAYQWQWQLGRLFELQGEREKAIVAYRSAFQTLKSVRGDLVAIDSDVQFSFRDNVEPVYRQLVDLLLRTEETSETVQKQRLSEAIEVIDSLQLAELENFLRCDLSGSLQVERVVGEIDPGAAFIYPIILSDRLEILFKLPQQSLRHRAYPIDQSEVEQIVSRLQKNLARPDRTEEVREDAQRIYNWLIKPLEEDLEDWNFSGREKTLVFVLDGPLRNVPMAVLYNQGRYLVEKYAVAVIPSRQLFDPRPRQQQLKVLTAGVSEAQKFEGVGFKELSFVPEELEQIQEVADSPSQLLLNQVFTDERLAEQIEEGAFPIVHIATHGEFSSDPSATFILAWGKRIQVRDLERILRIGSSDRAIELLVLSACQTARGNRRAALGIAGVAAQARVRTTVATLWQVDDQTTANLMAKFYEGLRDGKTIAAALRDAELYLLRAQERRPHYWAPFVIVGNWL